jgi:hypothetical protein
MRHVLAAAVAVAASALGALILGEYELAGTTPFVAGVLFGLVVAELVLTVAKPRPEPVAAVAAVAAPGLAMVWAAWISAGRTFRFVPHGAWAGVVLASAAAAFWLRSGRRRAVSHADDGEQRAG